MSIMSGVNGVKLQMCCLLLYNFISFYACTLVSIYLKKNKQIFMEEIIINSVKKRISEVKLKKSLEVII